MEIVNTSCFCCELEHKSPQTKHHKSKELRNETLQIFFGVNFLQQETKACSRWNEQEIRRYLLHGYFKYFYYFCNH